MNHHDSNNRLQYVVALLTTTIIVPTFLQSSVNIVKLASAEDATKSSVPIRVPIGVILDLENESGKVWNTTISMAIEDFYTSHTDYKTRLALNIRDSKKDVSADATSIVLDLLNNVEVKSIIQPIASAIVSELGGKAQVPVISFSAMNPSLSHANAPYFIRTGLDDSSQTNAIADIVTHFGWREVVPIYEDSEYGHKIIPFLYEALSSINAKISYRGKGILSPTATDNQISSILDVLKLNEARVFVVHVRPSLGWQLFKKVDEIGMMEEGYVWIITDEMTSALGSVDPTIVPLDSMQGVLGVKTYIHEFESLQNFMHRWKAMLGKENLISSEILRAYDMVCAIAIALEKIGSMTSEMEMLKKSSIGPRLLDAILTTEFSGIIGKFHLIDGQLPPFPYQVVNLNGLLPGRVVGFWKPGFGLSRRLSGNGGVDVLGPVIWPGEPKVQPDGRRRNLLWKEGSIKSRQINVTVPMKDEFNEFVKVVSFDPITKEANVSGFSIDVFREAIKNVGLEIDKYYAFEINETNTYDDMCEKIKDNNVIVGDVTILANRLKFVDFTVPYTETGMALLVPKNDNNSVVSQNQWIIFKPWKWDLWLATFGFLLLTMFVLWVIEHRINPEFRGSPSQQMSLVFYLAFSTIAFPQKEKMVSSLSRMAFLIWVLVMIILWTSYTAGLSSMLTVQNLKPPITDLDSLLKNNDYVGYKCGNLLGNSLLNLGFDESKTECYKTRAQYYKALSVNNVSAIYDEIPYIKVFLSYYSANYTMVVQTNKGFGQPSNTQQAFGYGFGFVFPKGDSSVSDVSRGVLNVIQGKDIRLIEKKWFGVKKMTNRKNNNDDNNNIQLSFKNFKVLFLITGGASATALIAFLIDFACHNWEEIKNVIFSKSSLKTKLSMSAKVFDKKDSRSYTTGKNVIDNQHINSLDIHELVENSSETSASSTFSYTP